MARQIRISTGAARDRTSPVLAPTGPSRTPLDGSQEASQTKETSWPCVILSIFLLCPLKAIAAESPALTDGVSFSRDIAPVLAAKCVTCHGPEKSKGRYRLDRFTRLTTTGESKETPIIAGEPARSHLFQLITAPDPDDRMPQKDDPLPPQQIALIERWIKEGAQFDGADPERTLASLTAAGPQPDPPSSYNRPVPVVALAFNPTGQELAAGGYHEITLWDPSQGKLLRRVKNVAQQTQALAFSPDGSLLASAGGTPGRLGEVKLFNPVTGALVQSLATSGDTMLAVIFSADGKRLAAAGADNTIRLFDVSSGKQVFLIEQHADWVMGLAFSPDGSLLASASRDKTARLFDANTAELEETYTGHGAAVFTVAFSTDGKRVFSGGRDRRIHVWSAKDAKKISEIDGFGGDVLKLCAGSNDLFSICTDRVVRQYALTNKKPELLRTLSGHEEIIYGLALHQPDHCFATSSYDGEVRLWDANDGRLRMNFTAAPGYQGRESSSPR